jgi:hypothetical protein
VQSDFFAAEVREALETLIGQMRDMVRKSTAGAGAPPQTGTTH